MPPDPADVLLRKARDDERLARLVVGNADVSDEQIGFLAQQAVEKAIKAVLSHSGVRYRRTHDLAQLLDLLSTSKIDHPADMNDCVGLTPFAAEMRYDYLPPEEDDDEPFDRPQAMHLVAIVLSWAESLIRPNGDSGGP